MPGRASCATFLVLACTWRTAHALVRYTPAARSGGSHLRAPQGRAAILMAEPADDHDEKVEKALKAMTGFANSYCKNTGTTYCSDLSIPAVRYSIHMTRLGPPHTPSRPQVVLKGLAEHKVTLGAPLCPCRHYEDKAAEAKDGFWNCPCVPMRERHDCHCMLFLTADNEFAGDQNKIDVEHVKSVTDGMTIL